MGSRQRLAWQWWQFGWVGVPYAIWATSAPVLEPVWGARPSVQALEALRALVAVGTRSLTGKSSRVVQARQRKMGLSQETVCEDGSQKRGPVQHTLTISDWVRVRNTSPLKFPPKECSNVTRMRFYVETSEEEGSLTIDVDDFRLFDRTDPTAGAAGASGAAGAGGSGGAGGAAGARYGAGSAGRAG